MPGVADLVEFEVDASQLESAFGKAAIQRATGIALKRAAFQILADTRRGFKVGGWNPETGAPGHWPRRKVPDQLQRGLTKGKRAALKAAAEKRIGGLKLGNGRAKTQSGVVRRVRKGGKTLISTGRLLNSISIGDVRNGSIGVGTNVKYAEYHQFGAQQVATAKQAAFLRRLGFTVVKGTRINLPQRQIFVAPKKFRDKWTQVFVRELIRELDDGQS